MALLLALTLFHHHQNGYIGPLATARGLVTFMREQLGKPVPSAVVLGQITEELRKAVKS